MWLDESNPWDGGSAYEQPRTSQTLVNTVSGERQAVSDSGSQWGGFLMGALDKVISYSIVKDAAESRVQLQQQQQSQYAMQPLVQANGGSFAVNPMGMLLIGGVLVGVLMLVKK